MQAGKTFIHIKDSDQVLSRYQHHAHNQIKKIILNIEAVLSNLITVLDVDCAFRFLIHSLSFLMVSVLPGLIF